MNLDFAVLEVGPPVQSMREPRGQVGTVGTRGFTRVSAIPGVGDVSGTGGDGAIMPRTTGTVSHAIGVSTAPRPQVSPQRPHHAVAPKPNEIIVSPVSPLVPGILGTNAGDDDGFDQEAFEERAAIMEFDGGLSRIEAEAAAQSLLHPIA